MSRSCWLEKENPRINLFDFMLARDAVSESNGSAQSAFNLIDIFGENGDPLSCSRMKIH